MNESETYIRDHLLIQFMLENYIYTSVILENGCTSTDVEKVYRDWLTWLRLSKIKEVRNGTAKEGS